MQVRDHFTRAALSVLFLFIPGLTSAHAGSATWILNPDNGDWNTATNWTPATVPNGPSDVATFAVSNITAISFSQSVAVNAIDFSAGASAFTISLKHSQTLTISGAGVSNASGVGQNFETFDRDGMGAGAIVFTNSATAGIGNTYTNNGRSNGIRGIASTQFFGTSNAGSSTIINNSPRTPFSRGGFTEFLDQASAASSVIINATANTGSFLGSNGSSSVFSGNSTAGNAIIVSQGCNAVGDNATGVFFMDQSTADHATITIEGGGSNLGAPSGVFFGQTATAGNASITLLGAASEAGVSSIGQFGDGSTAGHATILLQGGVGTGPTLTFQTDSSGGEAAFTVNGNAMLGFKFHNIPGLTVGSLGGDGIVTVDALALTIGANNLSTDFAGTIEGGSKFEGSVIKIGTGTLILSGANTYGAGTTIEAGTLLAATINSESATGNGPVQVNAGTLGGDGIISGPVTVGTGSGAGAFLAPGAGTTEQKILRLRSSLTLKSDATYMVTFSARTNRVRTDRVVANGVAITNATIAIEGTAQGILSAGTVITLFSNISASPINGTFNNLAEGAIVTVNGNNLQASYEGGDGNDLTLTVVPRFLAAIH